MTVQPKEKVLRINNGRLGYFTAPASPFPFGKRGKRGDIGTNQRRLAKGAHQVLTRLEVDCRLSSNRRIDHRKQGGGNLNNAQTAHERRTGKTSQIAHNAATQSNYDRIAIQTAFNHGMPNLGSTFNRFRRLPRRHRDNRNLITNLLQGRFSRIKVALSHFCISDDKCFLIGIEGTHLSTKPIDLSRRNNHIIGTFTRDFHNNARHVLIPLHQHTGIKQKLNYLICNITNSAAFGVH